MNELALFGEKRMTVKEVAEALGYQPDTIQKTARALEANGAIARIEIRPDSSHAILLDENQVQAVKDALVPRDLTLKSKVESAITSIDIERMTLQVIQYHAARVKELEAVLAVVTPKAELADRLTSSSDAIDLGTVARVLALPYGRNTLFSILRGKKILMADNRPYQEYMDRGYFRVIEEAFEVNGKTKVSFKTLVYQKGVEYLSKILKEADK